MQRFRFVALALVFVAAGCAAQVVTPRNIETTVPSPPSDTANRADDVVYVRQAGKGSPSYITRLDARNGAVLGALPDGVVSADRSTLYRTEPLPGGTRTRLRVIDVLTGTELRSYDIDGYYTLVASNDGYPGLSPDGRWLALTRSPVQTDGLWGSGFVVVNAVTGAVTGRTDFKSASIYHPVAVGPDGGAVAVSQHGDTATRIRVWDVGMNAFLVDSALGPWDGRQDGFVAGPAASSDGRRLYWLDAGKESGPFVRILDLATRRSTQVALPAAQGSTDFEKYLLWSIALSRDGTTLYAVNPALGFIDEIDAVGASVRRTQQIAVRRPDDNALASIARAFFPVAEAKRYVRGGAVLSPDGRTLYAAGITGIAVIDTANLSLRATWARTSSFDSFTLTTDGARLYAISDQTGKISILRTTDGSSLGELAPALYPGTIVRIDPATSKTALAPAPPAPCGAYAPPDPSVGAEIQHLKTSATVLTVTSPCTIQVRISGGVGPLSEFTGRTIILRATSATTFVTAPQGDLKAIGALGLRADDGFTLSFDSRAFPDGSYPLNFMNR